MNLNPFRHYPESDALAADVLREPRIAMQEFDAMMKKREAEERLQVATMGSLLDRCEQLSQDAQDAWSQGNDALREVGYLERRVRRVLGPIPHFTYPGQDAWDEYLV